MPKVYKIHWLLVVAKLAAGMGVVVCTTGDMAQCAISHSDFPLTSLRLELPPIRLLRSYVALHPHVSLIPGS